MSAGNTGALMAISRFVLKTLPGIDRPAIATVLPNMRRTSTYVLDLGANVDCTAEHLLQFGIMGAMLGRGAQGPAEHRAAQHRRRGHQGQRGGQAGGRAAARERANFAGNVEGNDIYKGTVDVVVCDGFVGNVALKCSEGVAEMMAATMREEFARNAFTRLAGLAALGAARVSRPARPRRYNGASLLGLRGIAVKSHGSADVFAFGQALERAVEEVRNNVLQRIAARMAQLHPQPAQPQ